MGILWFAFIIPVLMSVYLLAFHRKHVVWWEIKLPFIVTIITILACQFVAVQSAIRDTEYWGHMAVKAVHEEPFSYDDT